MIPIFKAKDRNKLFERLEKRKGLISGEVREAVRRIITEVRRDGDRALLRLTERWDGVKLSARRLRVQRWWGTGVESALAPPPAGGIGQAAGCPG